MRQHHKVIHADLDIQKVSKKLSAIVNVTTALESPDRMQPCSMAVNRVHGFHSAVK